MNSHYCNSIRLRSLGEKNTLTLLFASYFQYILFVWMCLQSSLPSRPRKNCTPKWSTGNKWSIRVRMRMITFFSFLFVLVIISFWSNGTLSLSCILYQMTKLPNGQARGKKSHIHLFFRLGSHNQFKLYVRGYVKKLLDVCHSWQYWEFWIYHFHRHSSVRHNQIAGDLPFGCS